MAKNITPNQQEWEKELKRLNQFIKRAKKRALCMANDTYDNIMGYMK